MPPLDDNATPAPTPSGPIAPELTPDPAPPPTPATPKRELSDNEIAVTFDKTTRWWTARIGPVSAGKEAVSDRGPIEAFSALLTSLQFSGHQFDPDFILA